MKDFYIKNNEDNDDFSPLELEEDDPINIYISQVAMILGNETMVMGAPDMISGIDDFVFNTTLDAKSLETKIYELISKYCSFSSEFPTTVEVKFFKGVIVTRDFCFIDINIANTKTLRVQIS